MAGNVGDTESARVPSTTAAADTTSSSSAAPISAIFLRIDCARKAFLRLFASELA
ncbi:hypothetical protein [Bradyrhizobium sp. 143]|uniref:hypothetical protein n=1 Tax=Bradyrhizobium sp. 143 TaxID=2782619 RepID=UPI001FF7A7FE|nr:hypothetical protein [Bradyrhizobium sp. 143]MCK1709536.1 hypothetical protein [Bradyrhizobium sp. 143]